MKLCVRKECETPRVGHSLHEDVLPFSIDFERKVDAGDIATGAGERAHKTRSDPLAGQADNGNGPGQFLGCARIAGLPMQKITSGADLANVAATFAN